MSAVNKISRPLILDGWKVGQIIEAGEGFKASLMNRKQGSFIVAAHTGMEDTHWKFYGSLQDIHAWEISVNTLTDALVIREFITYMETVEGISMENDTPQEIAMNALWVEARK